MSKFSILTLVIIISATVIFTKYYSKNSASSHSVELVDNQKLSEIKQIQNNEEEHVLYNSLEQEEKTVQNNNSNQSSNEDSNDFENNEQNQIKPAQSITEIVRGDEDDNGVRHDINLWINDQNLNTEQKLALTQSARSLQKALVSAERIKTLDIKSGRQEAEILALESLKSSDCVYRKFIKDFNSDPYEYSNKMRELVLNTPERIEADESIDRALSGGVIVYPEGDTCEK